MNIFNTNTKQQISSIKKKYKGLKIGFTCSCFDLLHAGHMIMLQDAKSQCNKLIIGLQTDPTIDRKNKNKPVQSFEERKIMIDGVKYIDDVIIYSTESDLYNILIELNPDVRIIGTDWQGKPYTGYELSTPIHWHVRNHGFSTSALRKKVFEMELEKLEDKNT